MQNDINQLFSSLSPQTFGLTDPTSLTLLALIGPGAVMFPILFFGRELAPVGADIGTQFDSDGWNGHLLASAASREPLTKIFGLELVVSL